MELKHILDLCNELVRRTCEDTTQPHLPQTGRCSGIMTTVSLCEKCIHISFFRIIFSHNMTMHAADQLSDLIIDSRALSAVIVVVKCQSTCMSVWGGGG